MIFKFATGLALTWLLAAATPMLAAQPSPETVERISDHVGHYVDTAAFDGVVVIADGDELVYSRAFGMADYRFGAPVTADTRFRIASMSKQFTMAAIGRLIDAGAVRLDAPLATYLPDYPRAADITIEELIHHRAGIAHTNEREWLDMTVPMALPEIIAHLSEEPLDFEPGSEFNYSNGGYAVLAAVIERVSGLDYASFLRREFGADYPSIGHVDGFELVPGLAYGYAPGPAYGERVESEPYLVGNRIGGGSLYATAGDVLRFFRDSYSGALLTPETRAALFPRPQDGETVITGRSPGTLAKILLDLDNGLTVVTLSSNSAWPPRMTENIAQIYRGEEPRWTAVALAPGSVDTAELDRLAGNYTLAMFGWDDVRIYRREDALVLARGGMRTALLPTSDGAFFLPIFDWICDFAADRSGLSCRQTDPDADIRFELTRNP